MQRGNIEKQLIKISDEIVKASEPIIKVKGKNMEMGKCVWKDENGIERCESPVSEYQCELVGGRFYANESC